MGDNISDNGIRKMLKLFTGTQSVSNFRDCSDNRRSLEASILMPRCVLVLDTSYLLGFLINL